MSLKGYLCCNQVIIIANCPMKILELKLASWPDHTTITEAFHIEAKGPAKALHCPTVQHMHHKHAPHNAQWRCAVHPNTMEKCSAMHSRKQLHHVRQAFHVHCMLVQCVLHACAMCIAQCTCGARRTVANSSITGGRHSPSDQTDLLSHKCAMTIAMCYAVCSDHQV